MNHLKKIPVKELRSGMFLHHFEAAWIDNPFWRSGFLLSDARDLRKAHGSGIAQCWIDTARGKDLAAAPPGAARAERAVPAARAPVAAVTPAPAAADAGDTQPASFTQELQRAATVCGAAREATALMFGEARLGNAIDARQCVPLVNEIADSVMRNPGALISLARLKTSDDYTYMHSVAVCALMVALARELQLDDAACRLAGLAGLMHDIGKISIPLDILNKPGKLTDTEFDTVKSHPERGHALLAQGGAASAEVLDVCLHHHERFDGGGYPHGLQGEQISLLARMGAVCDVYDAVTSNRPYKDGWDPAESISRMISWKGHFDPKVLSAFIQVIGIYPTGSLVRMRSGRLAVVVEQNSAHFTKPLVKIFHCLHSGKDLVPQTLDLALPGERETIAGREPRGNWNAAMLDALWAGVPA